MKSCWSDTAHKKNFNTLEENIDVDVCIIGAGITGISTAYMLSDENFKICIIDKGRVGGGVTENTTAKVTSQHELIYKYLLDTFGYESAKKYLNSNEEAIKRIEKIIEKEKIECGWERTDAYVYTCKQEYKQKIIDEVEAVRRLGFNAEYTEKTELPFEILSAIKFPNQAKFHPLKYLFSLSEIITKRNVQIYENTKATNIKHIGNKYKVSTEKNNITAKYVVLATHYPIKNFPGMHFLKMYQDRSYAIAIEQKQENIKGMYISAETPTTSFRPINEELLIIGGEGHKTGENTKDLDKVYENLEKYSKEIYPKATTKYKWATQDCISIDKVPYIGEFSNFLPNLYVATGYKKWGMTTSNVAAQIISDKILEKENKYAEIYKATRFGPCKNHKEFGNMLKQSTYSLAINKIKKSKFKLEDIELNSGGVIEYEGDKVGIYKDKNGEVFAIKPYCKHLGCELSWNNLEKTWDCPCHGSRYDYMGNLITEPSVKDLDKINLEN